MPPIVVVTMFSTPTAIENYSFQENYFEIGRTGIPACSLKCDKQARMPVLRIIYKKQAS
jgi:hypothetical protein